MDNTKICSKCGRELPLSEFYKNARTSDGYYYACKDCCRRYSKEFNRNHREEKTAYMRRYRKTPMGRANDLLRRYIKLDREKNRGESDITPKWLVENILNKPCAHCGKIGWDVIGCNRLDNSKPHTMDNVEPCCWDCGKHQPRK